MASVNESAGSPRTIRADGVEIATEAFGDPAHGEALVEAVPGARLVRLEAGGHELNEAHRPRIIAAIAEHTRQET